MNNEAVWHDLECGDYAVDLPLWRTLAARADGPVLDIGAGTGRVALELASRGVPVTALDRSAALLDALRARAGDLPVRTVVGDARALALEERFALIVVPMQTLQLFGGWPGRRAFLRGALHHLRPGGLLAAALADAVECFDEHRQASPPPTVWEILGMRYCSQLVSVDQLPGRAAIRYRRVITGAPEPCSAQHALTYLDRLSPEEFEAEARAGGFQTLPRAYVMQTERYLSSTVALARAPDVGVSVTQHAGSNPSTGSFG